MHLAVEGFAKGADCFIQGYDVVEPQQIAVNLLEILPVFEHPADAFIFFSIGNFETEFAVELTPVVFALGIHLVIVGTAFNAPGEKVIEGFGEMGLSL